MIYTPVHDKILAFSHFMSTYFLSESQQELKFLLDWDLVWFQALEVFKMIEDANVAPDIYTFNLVIAACSNAGRTCEAFEVFSFAWTRPAQYLCRALKVDCMQPNAALELCCR